MNENPEIIDFDTIQKQQLLQLEILEKGYNAEEFEKFVLAQNPKKIELNDWTLDELQQMITQFQKLPSQFSLLRKPSDKTLEIIDHETIQKQNLLRKEVVEKGFDCNKFDQFASSKYPEKNSLKDWSLEELNKIIAEFQQHHQQISFIRVSVAKPQNVDKEICKKQNLLKEEIIYKGFDSNKFDEYVLANYPEKNSLNDWTFDELKQSVAEFQKQPQKQQYQEFSFIRKSIIAPKNFVQIDKNIAIKEFTYQLNCQDLKNCLNQAQQLQFQVTQIQKSILNYFTESTYEIKTIPCNYNVQRSYSDFLHLDQILRFVYPEYQHQFLTLPPKINNCEEFENLLISFFAVQITRNLEASKIFLSVQKSFSEYYEEFPKTPSLKLKSSQQGSLSINFSKDIFLNYSKLAKLHDFAKSTDYQIAIQKIKKAQEKILEGISQFEQAEKIMDKYFNLIPVNVATNYQNIITQIKDLTKIRKKNIIQETTQFSQDMNNIFNQFQATSLSLKQYLKISKDWQQKFQSYSNGEFLATKQSFIEDAAVKQALEELSIKMEPINSSHLYEELCFKVKEVKPLAVPHKYEILQDIKFQFVYYMEAANLYSLEIFDKPFTIIQSQMMNSVEDTIEQFNGLEKLFKSCYLCQTIN